MQAQQFLLASHIYHYYLLLNLQIQIRNLLAILLLLLPRLKATLAPPAAGEGTEVRDTQKLLLFQGPLTKKKLFLKVSFKYTQSFL